MKRHVVYDLRASEERMLADWRNRRNSPVKSKVHKKKKKVKKVAEINHAKGLSYSEFLASKYWYSVRDKVIKRDGNKCVVCRSTNNLRVHHINYNHHGFEHKHLEDLMTLCNECHKITHGIVTTKIPSNF